MNEAPSALLDNHGADEFINIQTRPSPLPPDSSHLGALEVCHLRCKQGTVFAEAESYFCCIVWCHEGRFTLHHRGISHTAKSGELIILSPGGTLSAQADATTNHGYYLLLDGPQASEIVTLSQLWDGVFPYSRSPLTWLEKMANQINEIKNQNQLASIGHALLITAYQDARQLTPDQAVWRACQYMQTHWSQTDLNVQSLLKYLKISRSTLSPRFRTVTGKSILQYLMDIRYQQALKMLTDGRQTISNVASSCGFPDATYFSTWFRKRHGSSPREFKKKPRS